MKINKGETYGAFVKRVRQTTKLTQRDFALRIGYSVSSLCAWENHRRPVPLFTQRVIDEFAKTIK